jgi:hypothetical protein
MNPYLHKRLFKTVRAWAKNVFENVECKPVEECTEDENCCKDILTRMHVGNIRYSSTNPKVGANLEKTTIAEHGPDSPFGKCIMISALISKKYGKDLQGAPEMFTEAANACAIVATNLVTIRHHARRCAPFFLLKPELLLLYPAVGMIWERIQLR